MWVLIVGNERGIFPILCMQSVTENLSWILLNVKSNGCFQSELWDMLAADFVSIFALISGCSCSVLWTLLVL